MSLSAQLDGASKNFIAIPQIIKFSNSIQKFLLCSSKPIELHLAESSSLISHQIVHLLLKVSDSTIHTVDVWV